MTEPMNSEPLSLADENRIIAERRKKLAALRVRGPAFPNDFERLNLAAKLDEAYGEAEPEKLQELKPAAVGGRAYHAQARHGQGELHHDPGSLRPHPGVCGARRRRGRSL